MMENVVAMQMAAFPEELSMLLGSEFFSYVLPWLLTFAIVYGILSHIGKEGLPQSNSARAIIGIVLAFIIAPALSPYVAYLMQFSAAFVALVAAFLVFIVLLEIFGLKVRKSIVDEEGKPTGEMEELSIFEEYPKFFAFVIGVIAIIVFFASGANKAIGIEAPSITANYPLLFFLGFMVLIVWWMISE